MQSLLQFILFTMGSPKPFGCWSSSPGSHFCLQTQDHAIFVIYVLREREYLTVLSEANSKGSELCFYRRILNHVCLTLMVEH